MTELGPEIVNTHGLVFPLHAPVHAPKPYPLPGTAVRVTCEFWGKLAEHVPGQLMPAGLLVTVPCPVMVTVSPDVAGKLNAAETVVAPDTVTVHVVVVLAQAPPHPANTYPAPGDSVSVTWAFCANAAEHVPGQVMPAGVLVTFPVPETVTVNCGIGA